MRSSALSVVLGLFLMAVHGCMDGLGLRDLESGGGTASTGNPSAAKGSDRIRSTAHPVSSGSAGAAAAASGSAPIRLASRTSDARPDVSKAATRHGAAQSSPQSGTLTAGTFDENKDPQFYRSFLGKLGQNRELGKLPETFRAHPLTITIRDSEGKPIGNARVRVGPTMKSGVVELISRSDGKVVVIPSWDRLDAQRDLEITVAHKGKDNAIVKRVSRSTRQTEIILPSAKSQPPRHLDLALVLDTTGSMGDELEYLKSEIKSIASTIHSRFPKVKQRYALVVYRDDGDEYVVRRFDFTPSIEQFRQQLSDQRADGGGDYPEAVDRGLEEAGQLEWREDEDTVRVLFLLGDAPPHARHVKRAMTAANALRKKGVAIYPVACSGYDDACEFVMRTCALMTGSQFLFLTDDSKVGDSHAEPHIPCYHVQRLDQTMIRMVTGELSGKRVEPEPDEIIRSVGQEAKMVQRGQKKE